MKGVPSAQQPAGQAEMSFIKVTNLEKNRAEIEFSIDKSALDSEIKNVYKKQIVKMNIPGFRRGKAPLSIVEKMYGKGVFMDEALNNLVPGAYEEAYKESGVEGVSRPDISVVSMDDENAILLKAELDLKPVPVLKQYKNLKAVRDVTEVTDEAVDKEIETALKRAAREVEITDRKSKMGDIAVIDFEGFTDGVAFEGGKGENHKLKLGSGQFIPGFEEQVVDREIGEEFDANVTFPENYSSAELEGKPAVFKCKLNGIISEEIPVLDDEFAKDMSFDTVEGYKANIRAKLAERYKKTSDQILENRILDSLLENTEVEIPQSMFDAEVENQLREYDMQLRSNGLDLNTYFQYTGQNLDQLRDSYRPRAERSVKVRLALEAVVKAEDIKAGDEDIEAEYKRLAELYTVELEKVKEAIKAEDLAKDIEVQKALELIKDNAVIEDEKPSDTEKEKTSDKDGAKTTKSTAAKTTKSTAAKKTPAKSAKDSSEKAEKSESEKKPAAKTAKTETVKKTTKAPAKKSETEEK